MDTITIKSYQVKGGDCFLITYLGKNILIDGGFMSTTDLLFNDLKSISKSGGCIDLLIITHIDNDHIGGIIFLLSNPDIITISSIWYNGFMQIFDINEDMIHPQKKTNIKLQQIINSNKQGDTNDTSYFVGYNETPSLEEKILKTGIAINKCFNGKRIVSGLEYYFEDVDISITILGPNDKILDEMRNEWSDILKLYDCYDEHRNLISMPKAFEFYYRNCINDEYQEAGYLAGKETTIDSIENLIKDCKTDDKLVNRSSISFVMKINELVFCFLGDSNPDDIYEDFKKYQKDTIQLMKVAHHGSKSNINSNILEGYDIKDFLISTDGSPIKAGRPTKPSIQCVAKILYYCPNSRIYLNYPRENYDNDIERLIKKFNLELDQHTNVIYCDEKILELKYEVN